MVARAKADEKRGWGSVGALVKRDQRTREARMMAETKASLLASLPPPVDAITMALVDNCCTVALRIAEADRKATAKADLLSAADVKAYAQLTALHQRLLRQLSQIGRAKPQHTGSSMLSALAEVNRREAAA
jgi:hypothetical protein